MKHKYFKSTDSGNPESNFDEGIRRNEPNKATVLGIHFAFLVSFIFLPILFYFVGKDDPEFSSFLWFYYLHISNFIISSILWYFIIVLKRYSSFMSKIPDFFDEKKNPIIVFIILSILVSIFLPVSAFILYFILLLVRSLIR